MTDCTSARLTHRPNLKTRRKNKLEEIVQSRQWRVGAKVESPGRTMEELSRDEQEWLRQMARGDESAFRALYERHQRPIYRFALHMSGNAATAEEVTQEVFMLLISNPKGYQPDKGTVGSYLFGIARNLTRRVVVNSQLHVALADDNGDDDSLLPASNLDTLDELTREETLELLRTAVLALPERYREAVVLCDLEEMSHADAAEALQCSMGTVASRLHRARAMLKMKLAQASQMKSGMLIEKLSGQKCAK
jgi:RNA polymerase sigma-70 factor, ECF subfamily